MPPRLLPSLLAATLAAACGGPGSDPPPPPPATTCPVAVAIAAPTFSGDVLPKILRVSCGAGSPTSPATSCHSGNTPYGHVSWGFDRTAAEVRDALVDVEPANAPPGAGWMRIAPYDVPHSWLVEKVTQDDPGGGYGARMPYSLPNLCDPTVQTIVNWIQSGAPLD